MGLLKKKALLLIVTMLLVGCFENFNNEDSFDLGAEEFSDTFYSTDWDKPQSRKRVESGDTHIGRFITDEMIDPKIKSIEALIIDLLDAIKLKDSSKMSSIMIPSAYNSFKLRYPNLTFGSYTMLRVALPDMANSGEIPVKFKVFFDNEYKIGEVYVDISLETPKISGFEQDFFKSLITVP